MAAQARVQDHRLEYTRPYLYPKQFNAIYEPKRYSLIEASTKAGKTAGCIVWLAEQAFGGKDGHNFWWVAPVSGQADIAFRRMKRAIPRDLYIENMTLKTITLINGAVIWFKSADKPDSLYGDDVHAAVADEASRMKEDAWFALRSTLTYTNGRVRIIGNVKGRRNWFFQLARKAEAGNDNSMGYHKITAADAVASGIIKAAEVEDAKRLLPDKVFRELYMAEPGDDEGNPFGITAIKKCVGPLASGPIRAWGWDLAKKHDFTCGIGLNAQRQVCAFERFQLPWEDTIRRISLLVGTTPALVDSTGVGDPIVERLQKIPSSRYEGYQFTAPSKQKLMEGLAVSLQSGDLQIPGDPHYDNTLVLELEQFEYVYTRTGVRYSAPDGFFDDTVCALALADIHFARSPAPLVIPDAILRRATTGQRARR